MSTLIPSAAAAGMRMVRLLGTVSLICGMLIVGTNLRLPARIRHNQEIIMRDSVAELLPGFRSRLSTAIEPSGDLKILPDSKPAASGFSRVTTGRARFLGVVIESSAAAMPI
jgi:hypothetical protein